MITFFYHINIIYHIIKTRKTFFPYVQPISTNYKFSFNAGVLAIDSVYIFLYTLSSEEKPVCQISSELWAVVRSGSDPKLQVT